MLHIVVWEHGYTAKNLLEEMQTACCVSHTNILPPQHSAEQAAMAIQERNAIPLP